jgi:hypothetical protein
MIKDVHRRQSLAILAELRGVPSASCIQESVFRLPPQGARRSRRLGSSASQATVGSLLDREALAFMCGTQSGPRAEGLKRFIVTIRVQRDWPRVPSSTPSTSVARTPSASAPTAPSRPSTTSMPTAPGAAGETGALPFVEDLRGVDQFRKLGRLLERRGFSQERIAKIMGGNFLACADRIWAT